MADPMRAVVALIAAALLAAAVAAHAAGSPVTLTLRDEAQVRGPTYTLGEIAELQGGDAASRAAMAAMAVGQAPRYGCSEIVGRDAIESQLRRAGRVGVAEASAWGGASQVLVRRQGERLEAAALTDAAAVALFAAWSPQLAGLEARPLQSMATPAVPPGRVALSARLPQGVALARRMLVPVDVSVDGVPATTVPVWFAVTALRPVRVARVALAAGELPREEAFTQVLRDVTAYPSLPVPVTVPLAEQRLRAALPADAVLTAAHVETRPAVARNEAVRVEVLAGAVRLETTGIALADAHVGQQVRVLNPASHDAYLAQVVADGRVVALSR